jgi:hypothetical protein
VVNVRSGKCLGAIYMIKACSASYTNLYLGAALAHIKEAMIWGIEVEGFANNLILKIKLRHRIDGYSHVS